MCNSWPPQMLLLGTGASGSGQVVPGRGSARKSPWPRKCSPSGEGVEQTLEGRRPQTSKEDSTLSQTKQDKHHRQSDSCRASEPSVCCPSLSSWPVFKAYRETPK